MTDPEPDSEFEPTAEPVADPSFAIPQRPERQYSRAGGLSYEGTTVFALTPDRAPTEGTDGEDADRNAWLRGLVERVLGADPYTYGDWFDLPMPVFLVHDRETGDVFRVAIRGGTIEFHVLPETGSGGLYALYERLCAAAGNEVEGTNVNETTGDESVGPAEVRWRVECRTDAGR